MDNESALRVSRDILRDLLGRHTSTVNARLWDGSTFPDNGPRDVTLVLRHPGALRAMLIGGNEVTLAEAYLFDDIGIEGSVESIFAFADDLRAQLSDWRRRLALILKVLRLPATEGPRDTSRGRSRLFGQQHSLRRDREAIAYHYDVSNDFYRLFLDKRMVYSCAYFRHPDDSLDTAQRQKLDHICRKLRLQPGQTLLDIGCGWGGLVIHAAQEYGVRAVGITLSQPQAEEANRRIAEAGLSDRASVVIQDYREARPPVGEGYDALVSVGMFEHVGGAMLPAYFSQAWELLRPGGVFMNHGIALSATEKVPKGRTFSSTYVFPDGELVTIGTTVRAAETVGFEVRDVESLREHYAITLRHWVHNLESNHKEALSHVDEPTYRVWRLYMSGSAHGFAVGQTNLYQTLLVKPQENGAAALPLTREDWYAI